MNCATTNAFFRMQSTLKYQTSNPGNLLILVQRKAHAYKACLRTVNLGSDKSARLQSAPTDCMVQTKERACKARLRVVHPGSDKESIRFNIRPNCRQLTSRINGINTFKIQS